MAQPSPRVLVVDDDEAVRNFVVRVLSQRGYDAHSASDGFDAVRVVDSQSRFDVFVIDVMMPGMRGDELARRLHDRDPDTKVLYFTGYADQFSALRPALREHEQVLLKPASVKELLDAVARRLQAPA